MTKLDIAALSEISGGNRGRGPSRPAPAPAPAPAPVTVQVYQQTTVYSRSGFLS